MWSLHEQCSQYLIEQTSEQVAVDWTMGHHRLLPLLRLMVLLPHTVVHYRTARAVLLRYKCTLAHHITFMVQCQHQQRMYEGVDPSLAYSSITFNLSAAEDIHRCMDEWNEDVTCVCPDDVSI